MAGQPDQGGVAPAGLDRFHGEFLILNLNLVAGLGLLAPVLGLQTGLWPESEGLLLLTVPLAIALVWIGMSEAAWRNGWRKLGVTLLALSAMSMGLLALWIISVLLLFGAALLGSPEFWRHLPVMMRENSLGWLILACLLGSIVILGRSLRRRGRAAASTFCNILSATLLVLMVLVPTLPDIARFAHALR